MQIPPNRSGKGIAGKTGNTLLSDRGKIGVFVTSFRNNLLAGEINLHNWFAKSTWAFTQLFEASAALIVHGDRHEYFVNEADYSYGKFMQKRYFGTTDLGWDRLDRVFTEELEEAKEEERGLGIPVKGLYIPNINSDKILVFNKEGEIVERQIDPKKVEDLLFDRSLQTKGSVMLVPLIARGREEGNRGIAYLFSLEVEHFELPMAGYAAFLLAATSAPGLIRILRKYQ